jgi:hypothetical protein
VNFARSAPAGDFLGMAQDRKPMADLALLFVFAPGVFLSRTDPDAHDLRQS